MPRTLVTSYTSRYCTSVCMYRPSKQNKWTLLWDLLVKIRQSFLSIEMSSLAIVVPVCANSTFAPSSDTPHWNLQIASYLSSYIVTVRDSVFWCKVTMLFRLSTQIPIGPADLLEHPYSLVLCNMSTFRTRSDSVCSWTAFSRSIKHMAWPSQLSETAIIVSSEFTAKVTPSKAAFRNAEYLKVPSVA